MRIAVSGATGFIGQHVIRHWSTRNDCKIVAIVRPGADIVALPACVEVVNLDVGTCGEQTFFQLGEPDVLLHLAWGGLPNYDSTHHVEYEAPASYRFIRALVRAGLKKVVATGTCYEYGLDDGEKSEANLTDPHNSYAKAKDELRKQLFALKNETPFWFSWARIFYIYGNNQSETSLYSQLLKCIRNGDRTFPMSKGDQIRDFLPIEAVVEKLSTLVFDIPEAGVINICSGMPISVRCFVEMLIKENDWKIEPALGVFPYAAHEPFSFWGSNRKWDNLTAKYDAKCH